MDTISCNMKFTRYIQDLHHWYMKPQDRPLIKPTYIGRDQIKPCISLNEKRLGIVVLGGDPIWSDLGFVNGLCFAAVCSGNTGLQYNE